MKVEDAFLEMQAYIDRLQKISVWNSISTPIQLSHLYESIKTLEDKIDKPTVPKTTLDAEKVWTKWISLNYDFIKLDNQEQRALCIDPRTAVRVLPRALARSEPNEVRDRDRRFVVEETTLKRALRGVDLRDDRARALQIFRRVRHRELPVERVALAAPARRRARIVLRRRLCRRGRRGLRRRGVARGILGGRLELGWRRLTANEQQRDSGEGGEVCRTHRPHF